ncbi:hypothetical protein HYDPIDRAFT_116146 [Hydnomerulius pinastri MD-312]|uniref:Unplaced genomic scaffold scaffold_30, whole genome shotgun sequence n=1 Tax=Hydnomerulius pinastri MD-312 TaxID=994086 RepID=A0A0C9VTD7_9AGAM|nr:hypothetical protein HYDPIDRAFT_116146 [Hydnomerulius pinastri MD-312]
MASYSFCSSRAALFDAPHFFTSSHTHIHPGNPRRTHLVAALGLLAIVTILRQDYFKECVFTIWVVRFGR